VTIFKREGNTNMSYEQTQTVEQSADEARRAAVEALRPYVHETDIANAVKVLSGSVESEGEGALVKAMGDISAARIQLSKSANPDRALAEQLDKADRALQREYLLRRSQGFRNAERDREVETRGW
jgi:hypothetical protein